MVAEFVSEFDGLAGALAEIIKFCPPFFAALDRLNGNNIRRMQRENSFYAFIADDAADGKEAVHTAASACNYCAGKDLDTLFIAFFDFAVDVNGIADLKMRNIFLKTFIFNSIEQFSLHGQYSYKPAYGGQESEKNRQKLRNFLQKVYKDSHFCLKKQEIFTKIYKIRQRGILVHCKRII